MTYVNNAALELMLGVSRELHPREFVGLLRGEGDRVTEVLVIPASLYGEGFAHVQWVHVPLDKSIIGSVHSHPTRDNRPSKTDLRYFEKTGRIHFIIGYPYKSLADVACYLSDGTTQELKTGE